MEKRKARNCYKWFWLSPLVIVPTAFLLYSLVVAVSHPISIAISQLLYCPPYSTNPTLQRLAVFYAPLLGVVDWAFSSCRPYGLPCPFAGLVAILGSALWHLILLVPAFDKQSAFVRWHAWQALLLAGLGEAVVLWIFLSSWLDVGFMGLPFFVTVLFILWMGGAAWGQRQVEHGDCSLKHWVEKLEPPPAPAPGPDQTNEQGLKALEEPGKPVKGRHWLRLLPWLPILALLGWYFYEQALAWTAPTPRWIVSEHGLATSASCQDLVIVTGGKLNVRRVEDASATKVTGGQASAIIDRVIARYTGNRLFFSNPILVQATFPDGQRRLAWAVFDVIEPATGKYSGLGGKAIGVYLDASTGEPLMLVTDTIVMDVGFGCSGFFMGLPLVHWSLGQFLSVFLLGIYCIAWVSLSYLGGLLQYLQSIRVRQKDCAAL
jgi:uncharacterized membrane protein